MTCLIPTFSIHPQVCDKITTIVRGGEKTIAIHNDAEGCGEIAILRAKKIV